MQDLQTKKQTIFLENKSFLKITGVEGVVNLTDSVVCVIVDNQMLEIKGLNIKAEKLSVESGELILTGIFNEFKFEDKKQKKSFIKRIFK